MKIKHVLSTVLACAMLVMAGCGTSPQMTKAIVKNTVQVGVAVGVNQEPSAIPYLRYAAPVVCEASRGTNIQPAFIVDKLQNNAQANQFKNPQAILIFNSAFGIYEGLYEEFGADEVENRAHLKAWLEGVCEGLIAGLPDVAATNGLMRASKAKTLPPHIR